MGFERTVLDSSVNAWQRLCFLFGQGFVKYTSIVHCTPPWLKARSFDIIVYFRVYVNELTHERYNYLYKKGIVEFDFWFTICYK